MRFQDTKVLDNKAVELRYLDTHAKYLSSNISGEMRGEDAPYNLLPVKSSSLLSECAEDEEDSK